MPLNADRIARLAESATDEELPPISDDQAAALAALLANPSAPRQSGAA